MGLIFNRGTDDSGCNNHHFGDLKEQNEYRIHNPNDIRGDDSIITIEEKHIRFCQHEQCYEKRKTWMPVHVCSPVEFELMLEGEKE